MNLASEVPPPVESFVFIFVISRMLFFMADSNFPVLLMKGDPLISHVISKFNLCCCKMVIIFFCKDCGLLRLENLKLKFTCKFSGITLLSPVPAWILLICHDVGWKYLSPRSQIVLDIMCKAGRAFIIGFIADLG